MPTTGEITAMKMHFTEMVGMPGAGHKLIGAAQALRELHDSMPVVDQVELLAWVRSVSDLESFVSGEDRTYYIRIAVRKKGLRRANLEHLQRYSSDEIADIEATLEEDDEYAINIWKSEWRYIENFLKQFEISYRVVS